MLAEIILVKLTSAKLDVLNLFAGDTLQSESFTVLFEFALLGTCAAELEKKKKVVPSSKIN